METTTEATIIVATALDPSGWCPTCGGYTSHEIIFKGNSKGVHKCLICKQRESQMYSVLDD